MNAAVAVVPVLAFFAFLTVLALQLPRARSRRQRVEEEIEQLEEHVHDLEVERDEARGRLSELYAERAGLDRPAP